IFTWTRGSIQSMTKQTFLKKSMNKKSFSNSYQEYLEIILRIYKEKENKDDYISNIEIATQMNIKPPSVTEFLAKLAKEGLIEWKKRKGVKLTPKGLDLANRVIDMHHLLEKFFSVVLELEDKDLKHRLACAIEHDLISEPLLAKALERSIGKVEKAQGKQP
nr:metal-dependent transcriptional regulator [Candidatus Sigynarchaeota archaeon]